MTITLDAKTEAALAARAASVGTTPDVYLQKLISDALVDERAIASPTQDELHQRLEKWIVHCEAIDWGKPRPIKDKVAKLIVEKFRRQGFSI